MTPKCFVCGVTLINDIPSAFTVDFIYNGSIKHIKHYYCNECSQKMIPLIESEMQFIFRNEKKLGGKET